MLYFVYHAYLLAFDLTHQRDVKFRHWHETLYGYILYENTLGPFIYLIFIFPGIAIGAMSITAKLFT